MTSNEIRASFLGYFERQGHRIVRSSSLVPSEDPSLLFTNAGMNQFKDTFLGKERRGYARATSSQKCMRVSGKHNDLENVGPSLRHHTFFEMLGNFSFGDYFKRDAIRFAWELLTVEWKLPEDRLFATVFAGEGGGIPRDDEAYTVWRHYVPAERIGELGLADNFWSMGDTGPCGRCSEIHYYRGPSIPCPEPVCKAVACSCDRYVEIWNNVFMEFDRQPDGQLLPLPAPSIDTGMGLERITAVLQGKLSNYDTDLFGPLLGRIGEITGTRYAGTMEPRDVSMRVVADHARAAAFLIADGVVPSNEWRGYVLRKIMRRAMRHGKRLGRSEPFLHQLVDVLVGEMGAAYPELGTGRDYVVQIVTAEEHRFEAVLTAGLPRLEDLLDRSAAGNRVVAGDEAFRLYDTFGVPLDFIEDLAGERHLTLDRAAFEQAMESQRQKARASSAFETGRLEAFVADDVKVREALGVAGDRFEGYTTTRLTDVPVLAVFSDDRRQVRELTEGQAGYVALERTPFYIEAGGQVSDAGHLFVETGTGRAAVDGLTRGSVEWPRLHRVRVLAGVLRQGEHVTAEVNLEARDATRRNHTATHLLHAALRQVFGSHVKQAGSLVAPDRLRFDFVHFSALTDGELDELERIVNEQVWRNTPVLTEVKATEEAIAGGATALFGEKYGDHVRVVTVPGFSQELCGGIHTSATGDIGFFTIAQESGVAAGVRRIEATTGAGAVRYYQERRRLLERVLGVLNATPAQAVESIERLQGEVKQLRRDVDKLTVEKVLGGQGEEPDVHDVGGARIVTQRKSGLSKEHLRSLADAHKDRLKSGVVIVASDADGKVSVIVTLTADLAGRLNATRIIKAIAPIVGGGGGGRADFAEAGGRHTGKIGEMLAKAREIVAAALEAQ
jgi:alanyl-tRNA synthetase